MKINKFYSAFLIFAVLFFLTQIVFAQKFEGVVKDKQSGEPMAFVNILACQRGTSTDLHGKFSLNISANCQKVIFSFVGYKSFELTLSDNFSNQKHEILLETSDKMLREVVVGGENPAHFILKKVLENEPKNNPVKIKSFQCENYNKFTFSFVFNDSDSSQLKKQWGNSHFLLIESVAERKFIAPNKDHEEVIANRVSGFQNPQFAMLASQLQPFTFYDEQITFFNKNYISPIASGTFSRYDFDLYDSLKTENDTIFLISFEPKENKNFEGLKGVIYVNKKHYALQNVIAEPVATELINFKIQQQYAFLQEQWFPQQINMDIHFLKYPRPNVGMRMRGQTFISNVKIGVDLSDEIFPIDKIVIAPDAHLKDEAFWHQKRYDSLTYADKRTYVFLDSIGKKLKFEKIMNTVGYAAADAVPFSFLSLRPSELAFKSNSFEGFRTGINLFTNDKLSKYFSIGGYVAYGFKDNLTKYGANFEFSPLKRFDFKWKFSYKNDLAEPTRRAENYAETQSLGRIWLISRMEKFEEYASQISLKPFLFSDLTIGASHQNRQTLYSYGFESDPVPNYSYQIAEISASFRYAYKEKFAQSYGARFSLGTTYPIFIAQYTKGLSGIEKSAFNYEKYNFLITKTFLTKRFGKTKIAVESGEIVGNVPYGLLLGVRALAGDAGRVVYQFNAFQTMGVYEFVANRYVHAHFEHNFGKLLFRKKNFEPEPAIAFNMGFGELNNAQAHKGVSISGYDKGYYEGGVLIYNLIKMNYLNIAKLGIGGGVFYRLGYYQLPKMEDNLAYKFLIGFSF